MDKENAEVEIEIAESGPVLVYADKILKGAMNKCWKKNGSGEWHFVRNHPNSVLVESKV